MTTGKSENQTQHTENRDRSPPQKLKTRKTRNTGKHESRKQQKPKNDKHK